MKRWLFVLILVLSARQGFAQSHRDVVADVVNDLRARGVDISGPCGALAIVKRVAWRLRAEGAGLLFKNTGNNCEERAVDIIVYPDGHGFDVLTGGGDANGNGPDWSPVPIDSGASRWRGVAVDPDGGLIPQPPPIATPPPVVIPPPPPPAQILDLSAVLTAIADVRSAQERIYADETNQRTDQTKAILAAVDNPNWFSSLMQNRYVQLAIAAVGTYYTTRQMTKP